MVMKIQSNTGLSNYHNAGKVKSHENRKISGDMVTLGSNQETPDFLSAPLVSQNSLDPKGFSLFLRATLGPAAIFTTTAIGGVIAGAVIGTCYGGAGAGVAGGFLGGVAGTTIGSKLGKMYWNHTVKPEEGK